jgi:uncharacterized membrane protein
MHFKKNEVLMNEQEKIEQLNSEMERLSKELGHYQQQIDQLQKQLGQLSAYKMHPHAHSSHTAETSPKTSLRNWSLENFIGLRLIHLVGIVVLVIGLSIGVKHAIDRDLVSEGFRVSLAYAAGLTLYILSLRLKKKYAGFSAILFSGAMASLYFTTYAAFVYYAIFSFALAFSLMILFTIYTVYKAIDYNRQEIALLGLVGAYAIPFLVSKNSDRAELFFLYVSLINIGVIYLSVKRQWKGVNRLALAVTWILFIGWAAIRYNTEMQGTGLLFMSFFFLLFSFSVLSNKWLRKEKLSRAEGYQFVLNNAALCIAALLVFAFSLSDDAIAIVCLSLSFFIALQTFALYYLWKEEVHLHRMLGGLSLFLLVVFIGFQWAGLTVTLLWLLTAVILFAWGALRKSASGRMMAILLVGITLLKLLVFDSMFFSQVQKIISYIVLGVLLLMISFFYQKFRQQLFHDED